jgi:hypothetical protein
MTAGANASLHVTMANKMISTLHSVLVPLAEITAIFLASYIILLISKFILIRLQRREVFSALAVEHINRLLALIVYSIAFITSVYLVTNIHEIIYFFIAIIVAILAANWKIIASITAYYVMILRREAYRTTLLEFPRLGIQGKIVNTTLLFTKMRTPTGKIVYIPNYITITEPIIHHINVQSIVRLKIAAEKPADVSMNTFISNLEKTIQVRLDSEHLATRAKDVIVKLVATENNKAIMEVEIPVAGFEPRPSTLNKIIGVLHDELKDYKPTITILL